MGINKLFQFNKISSENLYFKCVNNIFYPCNKRFITIYIDFQQQKILSLKKNKFPSIYFNFSCFFISLFNGNKYLLITFLCNFFFFFHFQICIFGTIANILNIMVLTKKDMAKAPINKILKWLAVADMFVMIEYIPFASFKYIYMKPGKLKSKK